MNTPHPLDDEFIWEKGIQYKTRKGSPAEFMFQTDKECCFIIDGKIITTQADGKFWGPPIRGAIESPNDVFPIKYKDLMPGFVKELWVEIDSEPGVTGPKSNNVLSDALFDKALGMFCCSLEQKPGYRKFRFTIVEIED